MTTEMGKGSWARRFTTGLSSLRDRARSGLAALRFNPSRVLGMAMVAAPFVAQAVLAVIFLGWLPTLIIAGGIALFILWVTTAVRLLEP